MDEEALDLAPLQEVGAGPAGLTAALRLAQEGYRVTVFAKLPVAERRNSFEEVELGRGEETIQEECKRCLRCDLEWLEEVGLRFQANDQ